MVKTQANSTPSSLAAVLEAPTDVDAHLFSTRTGRTLMRVHEDHLAAARTGRWRSNVEPTDAAKALAAFEAPHHASGEGSAGSNAAENTARDDVPLVEVPLVHFVRSPLRFTEERQDLDWRDESPIEDVA